jgi:hypothetical protein
VAGLTATRPTDGVSERAGGSRGEFSLRLEGADLPVFVTVLHAHPPIDEALVSEAMTLTLAVAQCLPRAPERVHVQYAPAATGMQAIGGRLVP